MNADLRVFKSMLQKIKAMGVEEVRMTVGNGKFHGRYVDPAHVAMHDITMQLEDCKIKPTEFGINLYTLFSKIQKLPLGNMREKKNPENNLKIKIISEDKEIRGFEFQHPMLTFQKGVLDIAGLTDAKFPKSILEKIGATANINTKQFKIFLKIAEEETDFVTFVAERKENKLRAEFTNTEDELTKTDLTYSLGGIEGIDLQFMAKTVKQVKASFSVDYMQYFVNKLNAPTMKIGLKDVSPLVVWWKEGDKLSGIYLLAPRIESE